MVGLCLTLCHAGLKACGMTCIILLVDYPLRLEVELVKCVREIHWSLCLLSIVLWTWTTLSALWTWAALASLWTWTTLTTLWTWTALALLITLWLLDEHTVRQLALASLLVYVDKLHLYLVAFLYSCLLDSLQTLPVNLRDMEQTVLARENLNEASVRHDRAHCALIYLAYLRHCRYGAYLGYSRVNRLLVWS